MAHVLLSLAEQPRHGYELAESLRAAEFEGVTASTVYRELAKLDAQGLVRSFWQSSQTRGPARHMYELTDEGRKDLADCADDIRRLRSHLADFLSTWASLDGAGQPPLPAPAAVGPPSRRPAGALSRLWKPR